MRILVTGAAGFIGTNLVYELLSPELEAKSPSPGSNSSTPTLPSRVIGYDALTYAGNQQNLLTAQKDPRFNFIQGDVRDRQLLDELLRKEQIELVMHLAAESHVDRSIDGPAEFLSTNIQGTFELLEALRERQQAGQQIRLLHVSTDEVFGSLQLTEPAFTETTPYAPNSPYSASKAASDHLARAWHHTYGLDIVSSNCSNNYGPYQFPEKLLPLMMQKALQGERLPVYGDGSNRRDWLHVQDHVRGLWLAATRGKAGESYNFGGGAELSNLELVKLLLQLLRERGHSQAQEDLIEFVRDRPGHDWRYAINSSKAQKELGWQPEHSLETGLAQTIDWYLNQQEWLKELQQSRYQGQRLGAAQK